MKNRCIEPCLLVVREKAQKEGAGGCGKGGKEDAESGREEEEEEEESLFRADAVN